MMHVYINLKRKKYKFINLLNAPDNLKKKFKSI